MGDAADEFPADDVLALALATTAPDASPDAWRSALVGFVPALAQVTAPRLYLPRAWMGPPKFEPAWSRTLLERSAWICREPVVAPPRRGHNARCECGSGKKAKRCCGAQSA